MNRIKLEDYEAEVFRARNDGDVNIIVSDCSFRSLGATYKKIYFNMSEAVLYYLADLKRVYNGNFLSGDIQEAMGEYIALFEGIAEKIEQIGHTHNAYCQSFVRSVDELDEDIYEPGCDPRDYTTDRMNTFCRRIADAPGHIFEGLDNWINNGFEFVKNQLFNITGGKLGAAKSLLEIRAAILDDLDYEQKDIKNIHELIIEEDIAYGQKFADLYHEYAAILGIIKSANEIVCNVDRFTKAEISGFRNALNEIHIGTEVQEQHILTLETAAEFCAREENKEFFNESGGVLQDARNDMGLKEAIIVGVTTATDQASAEILKSYDLPENVTKDQAFEYFLIKKELAEAVAKVADNEVDVEAFLASNPDIQQWYSEKMASDNTFNKLVKMAFGDQSHLLELDESYLKALAATWWDYEKNKEVIMSVYEGLPADSLTAIAAQELLQEYSNYSETNLINGLKSLLDGALEDGAKDVNKIVIKLMGETGEKISAAGYMLSKAAELTGITDIGNNIAKFDCLQRQNTAIEQAYKQNFDIIASGNYTEHDVVNLNNSFELLKNHYTTQFDLLQKIAGKNGEHAQKRYYGYLERQMKNATITEPESTMFLTFEQYCAKFE